MKVYVKSQSGKWLMPMNPANARILLKKGKARVIQRTPFAIQLLYETTEYVQPVTVGIDDGEVGHPEAIPEIPEESEDPVSKVKIPEQKVIHSHMQGVWRECPGISSHLSILPE